MAERNKSPPYLPTLCIVKMKVAQSCPTLWDPMDYIYSPWNSPDKDTGVGCHSFLQGIFPSQGSNPSLLHCRQLPYCLNHQGSPLRCFSPAQHFVTLWTARLFCPQGYSRQEYWGGLPCPPAGDLPNPHLVHLPHRQASSPPPASPGKPPLRPTVPHYRCFRSI